MEEGSSGQRNRGQIHSSEGQRARSWRRGEIQEVGRAQGEERSERAPVWSVFPSFSYTALGSMKSMSQTSAWAFSCSEERQ